MIHCEYCGAEAAEELTFCSNCGTRMAAPAEKEERRISRIEATWDLDGADGPTVSFRLAQPEEEAPRTEIPKIQLPTERGWVKMLLLGIVTLGIYPAVIWSRMASEMNITASRYDGKRTMPWFAMAALSVVTLSVFWFVWNHRFCRRVGAELQRRCLDCRVGAKDFWLWNVLAAPILVGPVIYIHRVTRAVNRINEDFNRRG